MILLKCSTLLSCVQKAYTTHCLTRLQRSPHEEDSATPSLSFDGLKTNSNKCSHESKV